MQLFFHPDCTATSKEVVFTKEESRHICKVLRKREGDPVQLTNGKGYMFEAQLLSTDPKRCIAEITKTEQQTPLPYQLHMVVAPTKNSDRYEWFLEKATEIGISEITPIICERSERRVIKEERLEKIIQSAAKQTLSAFLPKLNPPVYFKEFVASNSSSEAKKYIAHCEDEHKVSLKNVAKPAEDQIILIGPEGDFSLSEIEMASKAGYLPITLGDSRLRTETAAIVACHSIAFINGN